MLTKTLWLQSLLVGSLWLAGLSQEFCEFLWVQSESWAVCQLSLSVRAAVLLFSPVLIWSMTVFQTKNQSHVSRDGKLRPAQSRCVLRDWALHFLVGQLQLQTASASGSSKMSCSLLSCVGFHNNNTVLVSFLPGWNCIKITPGHECHRLWVNRITTDSSRNLYGHVHLRAAVGNLTNMGILLCYALRIAL